MLVNTHVLGNKEASEILADEVLIRSEQDAVDIMGEVPSEYLILYQHNFDKDFFDLSTRKLGEILQKFTTYHIKVAIIGSFDNYSSNTLKDFIYESNKHGDYLFVTSIDEVKKHWQA
jgi:hypothetical protein